LAYNKTASEFSHCTRRQEKGQGKNVNARSPGTRDLHTHNPDGQTRADYVGYLIGDVSRMIRTVYDRRVETLGLTRAQWRVMTRLNRLESCTQTELATELEIEKPTLGKLIDRADENDARSKRLFLTAAAHPLLAEMTERADEVIEGVFAGIGADESAQLRETLSRIKVNLSDMLDPASPSDIDLGGETRA
jgi:MarR family transcriptional regulator, transcriptional regulator for hemolysin